VNLGVVKVSFRSQCCHRRIDLSRLIVFANKKNMSEPELRLDPAIRLWVFLPIVAITFLVGIVRHYVSILLTSAKKVELAQVRDSQILLRSR